MISYCPNCCYTEDYKSLDLCPECFSSMVDRKAVFNANVVFVETDITCRGMELTVEG